MDYNAVTTNLLDQDKLKKFIEFVLKLQNERNHKLFPYLKPNFCAIRSGKSDLINQDGTLSMCGKVRPEYDLSPVNVLSIKTADDYEKFIQSKYEFKLKSDVVVCENCEAKHICGRCPKFINLNKNFDGTSDVCSFYKLYHNLTTR
jgi:radical SAM protein with 4Fe4S-binding SPASM domain